MPRQHWSDKIIKDIQGAFKVFIVAAILIFVALAVAKNLYPTFPLDNTSSAVVAVIVSLFFSFIGYTKNRARPTR
jgi:amino acid transporter